MKNIRYRILEEVNIGTDENPEIVQKLRPKSAPWSIDSEEAVKKEAYNGEYTIDDDGQPEPGPTEQEQLRADVDFLLAMGGML